MPQGGGRGRGVVRAGPRGAISVAVVGPGTQSFINVHARFWITYGVDVSMRFRVRGSMTGGTWSFDAYDLLFPSFLLMERDLLEASKKPFLLCQLKCKHAQVGRYPKNSWRSGACGFPSTCVFLLGMVLELRVPGPYAPISQTPGEAAVILGVKKKKKPLEAHKGGKML